MLNRILVAYATLSGTTAEVAKAVGEEIAKVGARVDVLPLEQVGAMAQYDGVVLGGPMIMGWHRSALGFLRAHRKELNHAPLAVFVTAMSLTLTGDIGIAGVPFYIDENLPKPPQKQGQLSFRERYSKPGNYAKPILNAAKPSRPVSIGFFGGRLEYGRLPWWAVLFAMAILQAPAGEKRNFPAIRNWAALVASVFETFCQE